MKFEIPFYRYKKLGDRYLITVDNGAWIFLTHDEFIKFYSKQFESDKSLFNRLEQSLIIKTPNNLQKYEEKDFRSHWYRGNGTSLHIVIPTLRCNFTCKYCYAFRRTEDAEGFDMNPETAKKVVDFIFQTPAKSIVIEFSGGEPLLKFDIIKLVVEYAQKLKRKYHKMLDFAVVTNGSLLDEEKFQFFKKHRVGICFSFDGPKEIHDYHRKFTLDPHKSTYDEVVKRIRWLKDEKRYPFVFAIPVITKKTLKHWKDVIDEYVKQKIFVYRFKYLSFFGFASSKKIWDELGYTPEEFVDGWKKTLNYLITLNKKDIHESENFTLNILRKLLGNMDPGFAEMQTPCGAVIGQMVYDYDGSIYTCDEARTLPNFKLGNVKTSTYRSILTHPTTRTMISTSSLIESCYNCPYYPYCGICPLENFKRYGTFVVNVPNNYRCKIHKGMFDYIFEKLASDEDFLKIVHSWINVNQG